MNTKMNHTSVTEKLSHEIVLNDVTISDASEAIINASQSAGFKQLKSNSTENTTSFEMIYGSKIVSLLTHFIPYIGVL